ncbi:hypothetical protein, partial [Staphylococcus epidermidis]|uniref:hypothetical protein n=1 Tax=Staphylococcus epidermidis TaxID=1282 RepID=UPI001C92E79E
MAVIFDISTNPKGDVKFTTPISQHQTSFIFSKIYPPIINPKHLLPPKTNIPNIQHQNHIFFNKPKFIIPSLLFTSHTINNQKLIININKFLYTHILKNQWSDQHLKLT